MASRLDDLLSGKKEPDAFIDFLTGVADPRYQRGAILPIVKDSQTGETSFGMPQVLADLIAAMTLPGDVYAGRAQVFGPDGHVSDEVIKRSADLAGAMTLGAGAIPADKNSLRMGIKAYHGSPDIRWMDEGKAFSGENPVNAASKYLFVSPKKSVAENYAGLSEMALWRAENGMGSMPSPHAGVRKVELIDKAKIFKVKDIKKAASDLGVEWNSDHASFERLLDAAKNKGFDAVQMVIDGGNIAVVNPSAIKKVGK